MIRSIATVSAIALFSAVSSGQAINVGPATITPLGTNWYNPVGENSGGGSSFINGSYTGIDADGSAQINGDRTRFINGNLFPSTAVPLPNLGLVSGLTRLSYDWTVTSQGTGVVTAQAPAMRMTIWDPTNSRRIDIVWEDGEQSSPVFVNGAGSLGTVYNGDFFGANSRVYARTASGFNTRGLFDGGGSFISGSDAAMPYSQLIANLPSGTYITGLTLGVGSSVGSGFTGYADHVDFAVAGGIDTTMNFVPAPGAAALLGIGGLLATRRRR